jgi:uncharacterized membrane protein YgcG
MEHRISTQYIGVLSTLETIQHMTAVRSCLFVLSAACYLTCASIDSFQTSVTRTVGALCCVRVYVCFCVRMLRCLQLVRAPGSLSRLIAVRWDSSSTGRGDGDKRTKDPKIHAATLQRPQRQSSGRGRGGRHNDYHAGRGGGGGRGSSSGRGAKNDANALRMRQISLMQHIQELGNNKM